MSRAYRNSSDVPLDVIIKRLHELSDAVVGGRKTQAQEFVMRVPAECDHDADVVLAEAAVRLDALRKYNAELQDENDNLRKANQDCVSWEKACKADLDRALARVEVLDTIEAARAQSGQGVEPVAYMFSDDYGRTKIVLGKETAEHWCPPGETVTPLYTRPQPDQQGSVPEPVVDIGTQEREGFWQQPIDKYTQPAQQASVPEEAVSLARKWLGITESSLLHNDDITKMAEALLATSQPDQQGSVPDGWSITHVDDPKTYGYIIRGPGISYCAWKDKEPWLYLFCEALATTPQPEGDGWVNLVEGLAKRAELEADNEHQRERRNAARDCIQKMKAESLRKQADAAEEAIVCALRTVGNVDPFEVNIHKFANDYAQRLRQQADEAERAGGEK